MYAYVFLHVFLYGFYIYIYILVWTRRRRRRRFFEKLDFFQKSNFLEKNVKIDILTIFGFIWTADSKSPCKTLYNDMFKSLFYNFLESSLGCAYFVGFKRFL